MTPDDCLSCGEETPRHDCQKAKRTCGHHCNCSWTQDACCWCGQTFDEGEMQTRPLPPEPDAA